jgi:hypothetical protein
LPAIAGFADNSRFVCRLNASAGAFELVDSLRHRPALQHMRPAGSIMRAKPAVVNGEPCSDVNTNGDLGSFFQPQAMRGSEECPRLGFTIGL